MDRTELNGYLEQYEQLARDVAQGKRDLLGAEWDVKDDLISLAKKLLGGDNPQTGKPHSWTSAEKSAKESEWYRGEQIDLQRRRGEIEIMEAKSRSLYILRQWMIREPAAVVA